MRLMKWFLPLLVASMIANPAFAAEQLTVKTLTGKSIIVDYDGDPTVAEIKLQIEAKEGVPPAKQRLIYAGRALEDDRHLSDYGMTPGSTIHLIIRI